MQGQVAWLVIYTFVYLQFLCDPHVLSLYPTEEPPPSSQSSLVMFVQVECPGYATVLFNTKHGECQVQFGNGTAVNTALNGSSDIYHHDGGYIRIDENGAAIYYPQPNPHIEVIDPNHRQVRDLFWVQDSKCVSLLRLTSLETSTNHYLMGQHMHACMHARTHRVHARTCIHYTKK